MKNYQRFLLTVVVGLLLAAGMAWGQYNVPANYATIQAAIDAAPAGSSINVAAGTYNETINFNSSFSKNNITIVGASDRPVVTGGVNFQNAGDFSGLTLRNLCLKGDGGANRIVNMGNPGAVHNFTVDDCVLDGENIAGRFGIYGTSIGAGNYLTITNTEFKNIRGWAGIYLDPVALVTGWKINDNTFTNCGATAIAAFSQNGIEITRDTIDFRGVEMHLDTWAGIHVSNASGQIVSANPFIIKDNIVYGPGKTVHTGGNTGKEFGGIIFRRYAATNAIIRGNTITDSWRGINIGLVSGVTIEDNDVSGCGAGISVENVCSNIAIIENDVRLNDIGILFPDQVAAMYGVAASVSGVSIHDNNISNNTDYGVKNIGAGTVDATNNWWGASSGPSHSTNPSGTGNSISDNVNYSPWLGATVGTSPMTYCVNTTGTIQEAINAASSGDAIQVVAGTYVEQLTINKSLTLVGANAGVNPNTGVRGAESILDYTTVSGSSPLILLSSSGKVIIDGFKLVDNNATGGRSALGITAVTTHEIRNCIFERVASGSPGVTRGIEISPSSTGGIMIDGNLFKGGGTADLFSNRTWTSAIYSNAGGTATAITNNVFRFCRTAINFDDFTSAQVVTGNTFDQNGTAMSFGGSSPTSGNFTIAGNALVASDFSTHFNLSNVTNAFILDATGNTFDGNLPATMSLSDLFTLEFRIVNRMNVGKFGFVKVKDGHVFVVPALYGKKGSIQEGIDAASSGWTVNVAAGTYNPTSTIIINKDNLVLQGPQANVDPRPSQGSTRTAGFASEAIIDGTTGNLAIIIQIDADSVVVNGFEIKSGTGDMVTQTSSHAGTVVKYNIIHDGNGDEGVQLKKCTGGILEYNYVYDIASPGDALNISDFSVNGSIRYNEVYDIGSENAAIYVYGSTNMEVVGNLVRHVTQNDGIKLGDKNGADASKTGGLIKDNLVYDTKQDGITVYMSGVTVEGNEVYGSTSENGAIYVAWAVSDITIRNNIVRNNTLATGKWGNPGAIMIGTAVNPATVHVNYNNIYGNTPNGVTNKATGVLDATNNWWGTADGSVILTKISGNVDYDPWIGQPEAQVVTAPNVTVTYPTSGVALNFSTLPAGGGTVTVERLNQAPPNAPTGNVGVYLSITSTMQPFSFSTTITIDVSTVTGFNANTIVMYYNTTTSSWVAVAGGIYKSGPPKTFTFTTNHFTDFTFVNTPGTAYDIYLSSSTAASSGLVFPNTDWGATYYEPNDWDFTAPIELYIVPEAGSQFGACDIILEWDNTMFDGLVVTNNGIFAGGNFVFLSNTLGSFTSVTINASTLDNSNYTIIAGQYIAKLTLNLLRPGYGAVNFIAMDFRHYDGVGGFQGVFVTGHGAQVKSYLGDVASSSSEATGDGKVNFTDLPLWSISYWSGVTGYEHGMTYYKVKYDVGPTFTNTVYGLPKTDGKIQFEDLVIFAMSYGLSGNSVYPKISPVPQVPVELSIGQPLASGSQTLVPVYITGAIQDLRAASLTLSGKFGKFLSAEKGDLLTSYTTPVMLLSRSEGSKVYIDLSLVGADVKGIGQEGQLVLLRFEGKADVSLTSADLRNTVNNTMLVKLNGNGRGIPTEFGLSQNYPNPFNPATIISYQVPVQAAVQIDVFNVVGEKVTTLVNEVKESGYYEVTWNASSMTSGVYFLRINAGDFSAVKKMLYMK